MKNSLRKDSIKNEKGASLVEYVLVLAFISLFALVSIQALGVTLSGKYQAASEKLIVASDGGETLTSIAGPIGGITCADDSCTTTSLFSGPDDPIKPAF